MPRPFVLAALAVLGLVFLAGGGAAYALSLEEHNDFCASCHTQPEVDYFNRTLKQPPSDLASAHVAKNVRCIDCHSGPPPNGRLGGLMRGARDYLAFVSDNYHKPAVTTQPLSDSNCIACHTKIFDDKSLRNHYHFYLPDWQRKLGSEAANCITCHNSHTTANGHVIKFQVDTRVNPICSACHMFEGIRQ
ncbi:MAG: cytochrome c3 family protein [Chloroflexota bacterium]